MTATLVRPTDLPTWTAPRPRCNRAATDTVALLHAHATRGLVDADGPISDDQVVRSAVQMLRGHQPWAAR